MTTGTVDQYDADSRRGYIVSDADKDNERIPFELEEDAPPVTKGDRVAYDVRGGMAGIIAVSVRLIERSE